MPLTSIVAAKQQINTSFQAHKVSDDETNLVARSEVCECFERRAGGACPTRMCAHNADSGATKSDSGGSSAE
jgi:hypothetical protein